jgi:hypothetical protein
VRGSGPWAAPSGAGWQAAEPIAGQMIFADEVVVVVTDADLGILLRMVCHAGSRPVSRYELRDLVVGEPGEIRIDIPEGASPATRAAEVPGRRPGSSAGRCWRSCRGL